MVYNRKLELFAVVCLLCHSTIARVHSAASRFRVGFGVQPVDIRVGCQRYGTETTRWRNASFRIEHDDAEFIVLRFAYMKLPRGTTLKIRDGFHSSSASDRQSLYFDSDHRASTLARFPYYTKPIRSQRTVIDVMIPAELLESSECYGFHIDQYRFAAQSVYRGVPTRTSHNRAHRDYASYLSSLFVDTVINASTHTPTHAYKDTGVSVEADTCVNNKDESQSAACLRYDAAVFDKSKAIARLLVHKEMGSIFCTGWLLGCEGHIMTNHHCVADESEANATTIEFLAQGKVCRDKCNEPLACPGVVEATMSQVIAYSPLEALDYTLLLPRLPIDQRRNLTQKYGFLSMRWQPATLKEHIFIPQHPAGFGKRVALKHRQDFGSVVSLNNPGCNRRPDNLGYLLDTRGGSSGSPVISYEDKTVVGLHYCGGCLNSAIPAHRIAQSLMDVSKLPKCALADFQWPPSPLSTNQTAVP